MDVAGVLLLTGGVSKISALSADTTRALHLTGGVSKDFPHCIFVSKVSLHLQ